MQGPRSTQIAAIAIVKFVPVAHRPPRRLPNGFTHCQSIYHLVISRPRCTARGPARSFAIPAPRLFCSRNDPDPSRTRRNRSRCSSVTSANSAPPYRRQEPSSEEGRSRFIAATRAYPCCRNTPTVAASCCSSLEPEQFYSQVASLSISIEKATPVFSSAAPRTTQAPCDRYHHRPYRPGYCWVRIRRPPFARPARATTKSTLCFHSC